VVLCSVRGFVFYVPPKEHLLKKRQLFAVCGMEIDVIVMHVIICNYDDVQLKFYRYFDLYFL